jgi:hypothetical protein
VVASKKAKVVLDEAAPGGGLAEFALILSGKTGSYTVILLG